MPQSVSQYGASVRLRLGYKGHECGGETPLYSAARQGANPAILQLLLEAGADIEARTTTRETPLHTDDHDDVAIATYGGGHHLLKFRTLMHNGT